LHGIANPQADRIRNNLDIYQIAGDDNDRSGGIGQAAAFFREAKEQLASAVALASLAKGQEEAVPS